MSKVAIVTDTTSCIPPELVKKYDIKIIPVGLVIDRKVYMDDHMSNEDFWKMFYAAKEPVTTNATTPADFDRVFSEAAKENKGVCCILVSKALSATNKNALMAAEITKSKYPNFEIEILDSKSSTGAEGYIALEAAKAAKAGKSMKEVVKIAEDMTGRVKFVTVMQTLKYLIRSGRAPKAAMIGNWLGVKPFIGMISGTGLVESLGKARGMEKSITKLIEMVGDYIDKEKPIHAMVHYTDDRDIGEEVKKRVEAMYNCEEIYLTPYTPVMASQTGPVIAIAFYQ